MTHKVILHFRSLSLTDIDFDLILLYTKLVYAQYSIDIQFGSGYSLNLSDDQFKELDSIDGLCNWTVNEDSEYGIIQNLDGPVPHNEILVFYVHQFGNNYPGYLQLGCGGHLPNKPACIVASAGSKWVTAHEVCHVLLTGDFWPDHSDDPNNLMFKGREGPSIPILTDTQVNKIKLSPCCVAL